MNGYIVHYGQRGGSEIVKVVTKRHDIYAYLQNTDAVTMSLSTGIRSPSFKGESNASP
jgi:hypothetical protein